MCQTSHAQSIDGEGIFHTCKNKTHADKFETARYHHYYSRKDVQKALKLIRDDDPVLKVINMFNKQKWYSKYKNDPNFKLASKLGLRVWRNDEKKDPMYTEYIKRSAREYRQKTQKIKTKQHKSKIKMIREILKKITLIIYSNL